MDISNGSKKQDRWDGYGREQVEDIKRDPGSFVVDESCFRERLCFHDLMARLGPLEGREVLDIGCGKGYLSVFLAKRGARVTGMDIGPWLVCASEELSKVNGVQCRFVNGSAVSLPHGDESFDYVIGFSILHHLSRKDLARALEETHRVLRKGGRAFFNEPVENSRAFEYIQNVFPAGRKGERWYRPSILQRSAWKDYVGRADNRVLTTSELKQAGGVFASATIKPYGIFVRLGRLIGAHHRDRLAAVDRALLGACPGLSRFCQTVLVEYRKA